MKSILIALALSLGLAAVARAQAPALILICERCDPGSGRQKENTGRIQCWNCAGTDPNTGIAVACSHCIDGLQPVPSFCNPCTLTWPVLP